MKKNAKRSGSVKAKATARHQLRLPGFLAEESVGLGDVVARTTSYLGIRPCSGCDHRRAALNRWVSFNSRRRG
jgi:hypothetical protein